MLQPADCAEIITTESDSEISHINAQEKAGRDAFSVTNLQLTNYRNFLSLSLKTSGESVVITGSNGSGKTNILEAISFLVPGRGLRNARLADIERKVTEPSINGANAWGISAQVTDNSGVETHIGTGKDVVKESDKRIVKIDGEIQRGQNSLSEYCAICYLTPQMTTLFLDGTTARRNYLDRLTSLFYPEHIRHLSIYDHARSERTKLLKSSKWDSQWLDVLEKRMAEHSIAIAAARLEAIDVLEKAIDNSACVFPAADLAVSGGVEAALKDNTALHAEETSQAMLANSRQSDAITGRTEYGTHRSDFVVHHREKCTRADQCSTGEQKALLLAITLASASARQQRTGNAPILLLDEVVAHLDDKKRQELFEEIIHLGAQSWLTGTDSTFFNGFYPHSLALTIENGEISV